MLHGILPEMGSPRDYHPANIRVRNGPHYNIFSLHLFPQLQIFFGYLTLKMLGIQQ